MATNTALHSIQSIPKRHRQRQSSLQDNAIHSHSHSHSLAFHHKPTSGYRGGGGVAAAYANVNSALSGKATAISGSSTLDALRGHLDAGDFREADEETRRLLIVLAGEAAQKRGYVFFSEVQYIPEAELLAIDNLWTEHSDGRFGYSVQKRIFVKANSDFTAFFIRVGWMKKLQSSSDVDHYNYRSFPSEFFWEISDNTPHGHLPLTNALRGTQLLNSIFAHPAFDHVLPDQPPQPQPHATTTPFSKPNYTF